MTTISGLTRQAISCLLSVLLFTSAVQAQQQQANPDSFFVIDNFSKLLISHADPYNLKPGEASDAQNVRANDQYGSLAKRTVLNSLGTCSHSAAVTGLHRYYKADATKYTITTADQYVDYISDTGTCTNLGSGYTTGKRWTFFTYKNTEIGTDGYDQPIKWDGSTTTTADTVGARTAGDLVTQLGAPFAKIATGTGLTASRWYQYKIAWYDGTTYKYSTARSNPLLLGTTNKQITLTDIPLGPSGTTQRIIYRTAGDTTRANVVADTTFNRVTTISDNTTTTYTDSLDDATLAANTAPTYATVSAGSNVTPPHGIHPFIHVERIWLGNDPSGVSYGKSTVYFSAIGNPDYWKSATDYFLIRPDDGDEVTFVKSFLGTLTIGKTNTISKIYTDTTNTATWQVSQPFSFVGNVAPYSATITPVGIIYLGRYGIYKFDGQSSSLVSDVTTKDVRDVNPTNYANVASVYYNNEYRMAYTSQATGAGSNDRVLLFDLVRDSYVKDTENVNVWTIYNSSDDFGALYSGSSATTGYILAHSTQPSNLIYRYVSQLNTGTVDSAYVSGDEEDPILSLGWDKTWTTASLAWVSQNTATWQVKASPGYWYSPVVQVNATALSKLYWNEVLGSHGDVTLAIRTGSSSGAVASASWSSEFTNPAGSDISSVTANNYIQIRVKLTTSNFAETPYLYLLDNFLLKLVYSQTGTSAETSVLSSWTGGWYDLNSGAATNYPKLIKEVDVYYEGTAGTINFNIQNLKGDSVSSFDIDLSKERLATTNYYGHGSSKVFRWVPPVSGANSSYLYGDKFMIGITESGVTAWKVQRIVIRYEVQPYKPYTMNYEKFINTNI